MIALVLGCMFVGLLVYQALQDLYLVYWKNYPPGPLSLPLIGGLYTINPRQPQFSVNKLVHKYGSIFSLRFGSQQAVVVSDINYIDQIMENPDAQNRPPLPTFEVLCPKGDGLGSCDYNKRWKIMTRTMLRGMAKLSLKSLFNNVNKGYSQLVDILDTKVDAYENLHKFVFETSVNILNALIFGYKMETQCSQVLQHHVHSHKQIMSVLNPTHPINMIPGAWNLPTPTKSRIQAKLKLRDAQMGTSLRMHMDNFSGEINNFIDIIAEFFLKRSENQTDTSSEGITTDDMLMTVWTIFLAGCDTQLDTTMWCMLYLAKYPHVQEKVWTEINEIIEDEETNIIAEQHSFNYTRATVLEVLRLASPVHLGIPHYSSADIRLGDYTIPKGTMIMTNQYYVHHDETHWADPHEMKPERFLDPDGKLFKRNIIFRKMPYIPFSRGKRVCIGQQFALDLLLVFVVKLLGRYKLSLPEGYEPDMGGEVVMNSRPLPYQINFERRAKSTTA